MTKGFAAFFVQLFGISALLFGIQCYISTYNLYEMPIRHYALIYLVLFFVTAISHVILMKTGQKNPRTFVYSFMFLSVIRLIIYGVFLVIYGYKHRGIAVPFAIDFFILYVIFTAFEIWSVLRYLKGK